ncbi:MAG: hypothetical protein MJ247_00135 [Alphaproteobacteria bacterium]|nr:hypothetical protein [Alphaproteobacteria bacterium]
MANNDDWDIDDVDENGEPEEEEEEEEAPEYDDDEYDDELDDDTPDEVKNFNPADHVKIINRGNPAGKFLMKLILIITLIALIVTPFIIPQKMPTPIRKFVYKTEDCVKTGVNYTVYYAKFAFSKFVGTNLDAKLPKKTNFAQKNENINQNVKPKEEAPISPASIDKNEEISEKEIEVETNIEKTEEPKEAPQQNYANTNTTTSTKVFNLSGSGRLKDLNTTAKIRPELKKMLIQNDIYTFDQLPKIRPFLKEFIFAWTNGRTEDEVSEIIDADYKKFETKKMVEILTFTTFKRAGLVPSYNTNYVEQSPSDISSTFYVNLAPIVENISDIAEKIKYVEPCSTFLIKRCKGDENCLVSWDLLIEMLGLSEQKDNLKKFAE